MTKPDNQIDQLFQLPLDEFTAGRNALAKETGAAAVKKLEKPNLAAWAVNQLYWHQRKLYDEVIKTSGQVRTAHNQMLAGKPADVRAVEVFHAEAMRKAKDAIRKMLEAAGNNASDAVMTPVTETLDALPTTDPCQVADLHPAWIDGSLAADTVMSIAPDPGNRSARGVAAPAMTIRA